MRYPLAISSWSEEEIEVVHKVLESGRLTMGDRVKQFEQEFAEYYNVKYAIMVNSGSSANLLGAAALRYAHGFTKEKDEIIVPAVGWSTTYFPFHQLGYSLIFVDIDDNLCINTQKIREEITMRTRAICGVNLLGFPCDFNAIKDICNENDLLYIEDNCEALGAGACGTQGVYGTFSFFFSHHIQTIEGGMLITNDEGLYQAALALRAHGWVRDLPEINNYHRKNDNSFEGDWTFVLPGYNLRPSEINGALGSCQLKKLDTFLSQRRKNAVIYQDLFGEVDYCDIFYPQTHASWFSFPFLLTGELRNARPLVLKTFKEHGIGVRPIASGNFTNQPVMSKLNCAYKYNKFVGAEDVDRYGFMVGNNHTGLEEELNYTKKILEQCF